MISASITVTRVIDDEEVDIEVYVSGQIEYYGSANPSERGEHISDWSVDEPRGFELTAKECERAETALEENI